MNATVWRDEDNDLWVFAEGGLDADAWILQDERWESGGLRRNAEDFGPLIEVALDDPDLIGLPPAPAGAV